MPDPSSNAASARPAIVGDYSRLQSRLPGVPTPAANGAAANAPLGNVPLGNTPVTSAVIASVPSANAPVANPPSPGIIGDAWVSNRPNLSAGNALPAAYQPAPPREGLLQRILDWFRGHKPAPAPAPFPQPGPVPPAPGPVPPAPGPIPPAPTPAPPPPPVPGPGQPGGQVGSTPGIQVFFTNTYGTSNAANQATSQNDPSNPDHQLVNLIDSIPAGGKLDGAFFDIGVSDVVDALVRAKQRGVDVRLVTEHDYYVDKTGAVRPPIQQLQAAGITIIPDDRQGLMHDKFMVATGGPTGPTVWTGSYNITDGGSYHDNNNAMEIQSADLANIYEQEFKKMFEQRNFGTDANGAPHPQSQTVQVGNATITPYFSPSTSSEAGARQAILNEIAQAHSSVEFLAFSFTDRQIAQAMMAKAGQGVKVQGVFETSQAKSRYSAYNQMSQAQASGNGNLDVAMDGNPALMHHKVIIIDDSTLILGSFNFSKNAQSDNDENMIVIHNAPDLVAAYKQEFARVQAVAKQNPAAKSEGPAQQG